MIQSIDILRPPESFMYHDIPSVSIFVGPNNSGKSRILTTINGILTNEIDTRERRGVKQIYWSNDEGPSTIRAWAYDLDGKLSRDFISQIPEVKSIEDLDRLLSAVTVHELPSRPLATLWDAMLKGISYQPLNSRLVGFSPNYPSISLKRRDLANLLFGNNQLRLGTQKYLLDSIGLCPVVDITDFATPSIKFRSSIPIREKSFELEDVLDIANGALAPTELSDGYNAFSWLAIQLYTSRSSTFIIDEPEAFLHPSLARSLGQLIGKRAKTYPSNRFFIATHSPELMMGIFESTATTSVFRLSRPISATEVHGIDKAALRKIYRDPLLRASGVLNGLFSQNVVVVEGPSDRVFYQEVNLRLVESSDLRGIRHCLFIEVHGIHKVADVVALLRSFGVIAAGIVDIDALTVGGKNWMKLLEAVGIPAATRDGLAATRSSVGRDISIAKSAAASSRGNQGVSLLETDAQDSAKGIIKTLGDFGLFVVPVGEVEDWLADLNVLSHKNEWLPAMLERMGEDTDVSYVRPSNNDVWDFLGLIGGWMKNPGRQGMRKPLKDSRG